VHVKRCVPRAVFLPPDPPLPPEHDDRRATPNGDDGVYKPREDSIDRLLDDAPPENTWAARNERRTLSTLRGRSQWSVGADELNESLAPDYLQRHRHVLAPDEAFGAIFTWDAAVLNSRALELECWRQLAEERDLPVPDMDDIIRAETMAPEAAIERVFYWTRDWGDIKRLLFDKLEIYEKLLASYAFRSIDGLGAWLNLMGNYGIKAILCVSKPKTKVTQILDALELSDKFFDIVTSEDEFETLEQMFLVAAIKADRPPEKCVVFTDKPTAIAAAHEVSSKAVAIIGAHPAYEMKTADETIRSYNELVVYNVRRLFSEAGHELMDPQTQLEKTP